VKAPDRTPEDRASGVLRITIGNLTKRVPTLKLTAADEWAEKVAELPDGDLTDGRLERARLEAVLAYDKTDALGGRAYVEDHADYDQIFVAFEQMMAVVRPFAIEQMDQSRLLAALLDRPEFAALLSFTNGPSPSGDSTPAPSESDSMPSSSTTSGTPDNSGSAASAGGG
jgi:hypothetical protein